MPHTSRKKKPFHQKRQEVTSEDGWTQISRASNADAARKAFEANTINATFQPDPTLTLPKLRQEYDDHLQKWRASTCRAKVETILKRHLHQSGRKVTRSVCLGIGALGKEWPRHRSLWQLVAWLDMISLLEDISGAKIEKFVQEPALLPLDTELLDDLHVQVLQDEAALDRLAGSLIFAPFMDKKEEKAYACRAHETPLYITTDLQDLREYLVRYETDPNWAERMETCTRGLAETHEEVMMPDFEHDEHALRLKLYILKPPEEDGMDGVERPLEST